MGWGAAERLSEGGREDGDRERMKERERQREIEREVCKQALQSGPMWSISPRSPHGKR